jgi:hypothetical protein
MWLLPGISFWLWQKMVMGFFHVDYLLFHEKNWLIN